MPSEQTVIPKRNKTVHASYDSMIAFLGTVTFEVGEIITSRYVGTDGIEHTSMAVGTPTGYELIAVPPIDQQLDWEEY